MWCLLVSEFHLYQNIETTFTIIDYLGALCVLFRATKRYYREDCFFWLQSIWGFKRYKVFFFSFLLVKKEEEKEFFEVFVASNGQPLTIWLIF